MFWNRGKLEGALAASVYEELAPDERLRLDKALAASPELALEHEALKRLAAAIPLTEEQPPFDLLPQIRRRLNEPERRVRAAAPPWRWAAAMAAVALVVFVPGFIAWQSGFLAPAPASQPLVASMLGAAIEHAHALSNEGNHTEAYKLLEQQIAAYPDDPMAGAAQNAMADLAFDKLRWYPEAYTAYVNLAKEHTEDFQTRRENVRRMNLLAEARDTGYETLDALATASNDLERLESLMASNPASLLASEAATQMARLVAQETGEALSTTAALERARAACGNPVAVAQLDLELGHAYRLEEKNPGMARTYFERVAAGGNSQLAQAARNELASFALD
ncbi:MAG: hypothetical protein KJ052_04910 [Candidatus Hydrogenedentes bacterium]|nr:hypothetical protein [Candidatus Hydrogenedentota bacterium]